MLRTIAKIFGVVLILVGILGFIPMTSPDNHVLGIFHVNTLHNIIHLASGAVALWAGYSSVAAARTYFKVFGVVYALVTVLGFIYMDKNILGLVANNMADNLLHIVIAGSALYLGFGPGEHDSTKV